VTRAFDLGPDPFAAGRHRGLDLRAAPGTPVRSACAGVVAFAGRVPRHGRVVTIGCGRRRVSYLPLAAVRVRRGERLAAGAPLGTVGHGHGGLHVGVRRAGRRFGYEDPAPLFGADPPPPVAVRAPRLGRAPRPGAPAAPRVVPATRSLPVVRPVAAPTGDGLAPWPAWLGLGLLLSGLAGGARRSRGGGRRAPVRAPLAAREAAG